MKDLSRRQFIELSSALGLATGLGMSCGSGKQESAPSDTKIIATAPSQPNIVVIIMDTIRADKMSCYGFPHSTSPALDRLGEQGVVFDRVVSQCSWTRPSCGSLLTSLYPRQLGLYKEQGEIINDRFDTLSKILQKAGYATFGNTANPNLNSIFNFHKGFDTYVDTNVLWSWMERDDAQSIRNASTHLPKAPELFKQALDWAQNQDASKPHYIQTNAMEVHEWYLRNTMIRPEYQKEFLKSGEKYPTYIQSVRQLTDDVAQFVDDLSALPGWENTLFAIVSDHGEGLDEHKGVEHAKFHGWLLYESQVVVPWVLYNKAWKPKMNRFKQPVRMLELAPTLLDFAGVTPPADMQGSSLKPVLEGAQEQAALSEYFMCETNWRDAEKIGVYVPDWKYFDNIKSQKGLPRTELEKQGAGESGVMSDVSELHPDVVKTLQAHLKEWTQEFPKVPATLPSRELTEEEKEQLRSIGYIPD